MDYSLLFGLFASLNVFLGGLLVLKLKKHFNKILGFSGGVMLAVVFLEVLPEIIHLHEENEFSLILGFGTILVTITLLHVLSFILPLHEHGHHEHEHTQHTHSKDSHNHKNHLNLKLGIYGALIMIIHSFIDGFGIGLGFQVSISFGILIALAVMTHNFSDGINTVATLVHSQAKYSKLKILFMLNIFAPLFGVLASKLFTLSDFYIYIYLGIFSGSILYIAISEILPQAHQTNSSKNNFSPILFTILGVIFVFTLTSSMGPHSH